MSNDNTLRAALENLVNAVMEAVPAEPLHSLAPVFDMECRRTTWETVVAFLDAARAALAPSSASTERFVDEPVAYFINAHEGLLRPPLWTEIPGGTHLDFTTFELRAATQPSSAPEQAEPAHTASTVGVEPSHQPATLGAHHLYATQPEPVSQPCCGQRENCDAWTMGLCVPSEPVADSVEAVPMEEADLRKLRGLSLEVWACSKPQPEVTPEMMRGVLARCLPVIRAAITRLAASEGKSHE